MRTKLDMQAELEDKQRVIVHLNKILKDNSELIDRLLDENKHLKWLVDQYQTLPKSYGGPMMG